LYTVLIHLNHSVSQMFRPAMSNPRPSGRG